MGFFSRLKEGLTKTRNNIVNGIDSVFSGFSNIDDDFYEELEEILDDVPDAVQPEDMVLGTNASAEFAEEPEESITEELEEIEDRTIDCFNYSGTSHLLVISGLHLSLWSFGIMKCLDKFSKTRKYSHIIGLMCLFAFASITGFTVSVLRAGAMVAFVLIARIFKRNADNLNSIGAAVTFILIENPFAPFSVSLWLTVLSTVGILVYSGKLQIWIEEKFKDKPISKLPFYSSMMTAIAISFSTSVFTLPVFIYKLKMMPTLSILANFVMVSPAMVMMVATVLGVVCHIFSLFPFSRICFFITGVIGQMMNFVASKIGMCVWSTIPLNHKYYEYFFFLLIVGVAIALILKKHKIDIIKHISVLFTVIFCVVAVYCTVYDYNTPSVEVMFTSDKPVITVFSEGKSALIGVQKKKYVMTIKEMLRKHNEKQLDSIIVTENKSATPSQLIYLYGNFGKADTYYINKAHRIFKENSTSYATELSLSESAIIDFRDSDLIEININDKSILSANCKKIENIYENMKDYDIILIYGKNSYEYEKVLKELEERVGYNLDKLKKIRDNIVDEYKRKYAIDVSGLYYEIKNMKNQ